MAKNKGGYRVPKDQQTEFDRMVQRANRRIKASLKYIQQENIKSDHTIRSLVSDYGDPSTWATSKTTFSRSKWFNSEKDYKDFKRHVGEWGAKDTFARDPEEIKADYVEAIIKSLTKVAVDNPGVMTKNDRLPGNLSKKIRELSLEQLTEFFEYADPTEDIESNRFSSVDYEGVDREDFVAVTMARLNGLKELVPDNRSSERRAVETKKTYEIIKRRKAIKKRKR